MVNNVSTNVIDYQKHADIGFADIDVGSMALPFWSILQGGSKAVAKSAGDLASGRFYNSITTESFKELAVIPIAYARRYVRWALRDNGGGMQGQYNPEDVARQVIPNSMRAVKDKQGATKIRLMVNGCEDELVETHYHFLLVKTEDGDLQRGVLPLSGTQIPPSSRWISLMCGLKMKAADGTRFRPARFSQIYKLKLENVEKSGFTWFKLQASHIGPITDALEYEAAERASESSPLMVQQLTFERNHETLEAGIDADVPF